MILSSKAYDSVVQLGAGLTTVGYHFIANSKIGRDPQVQAETQQVYDSDLDMVVREIELKKKYGKPLVVASDALLSAQVMKNPSLLAARRAGQYFLSSPNRALGVLGHLTRYAEFRRRKEARAGREVDN
jgi:acyl-CoA synthetase (NDP forming)